MAASMGDLARGDGISGDGITTHAGFPNPAVDRGSTPLSLDRLLISHPSSTYFFRIAGHSWADEGIFDGDIALIDRAIAPRPTHLVVYWQEQGFALCRLSKLGEGIEPWGIVSAVVHQYGEDQA